MYQTQSDCVEEREQTFRLADGIVVLSDLDRLYWSRVHPNTYCIPNPCFSPASQNKRATFSKHILWLGRLSHEKQPMEILRIMQHVVERDPEIVCHVVGNDPGNYSERMEEEIAARGLSSNIVLEGFYNDVTPFYEKCSVFLMTSRYEGFALTLFEAASFGLPTVAYDLPWLSYYSLMDGWISVPQLDSAAAGEAIVTLVNSRATWQARSDALYQSALQYEKYDSVALWLRVFSDLENRSQPKGEPLDEMTSIFLQQITYFHGVLVRNYMELNQKNKDVIRTLNRETTAQRKKLKQQEGQIKKQAEQIKEQKAQIKKQAAIKRSLSYRFARLISAPLRAIKVLVKKKLLRT